MAEAMIGRDLLLRRERDWSFGDDYVQSDSGLYLPADDEDVQPSYPVAVDLFAGAGGFSLGFHQAGFHVAGALEWDFWAAMTYLANLASPDTELIFASPEDEERWEASAKKAHHKNRDGNKPVHADAAVDRDHWGSGWLGNTIEEHASDFPADRDADVEPENYCLEPCEVFVFGDARKVSGKDFLAWLGMEEDEITCIIGGPPCQGFSRSGKRQVMDPRNSLVFDFMRIVTEMRPQAFLMENVPGIVDMVTPEGLPIVDALCRIAQDGGFGNYDSIKRALLNTGAGGALSGKPESVFKSRRKPASPKPDPDSTAQTSLFDEEAAS